MTFSLVILGAPRTKKTSNRLGWRYSRRLGRKVRVVLPSAAWSRWAKGAVIVVREAGRSCSGTYFMPGRGRKLWPVRYTYEGAFFLGLHPVTAARVRCVAKFYRQAQTGDASGFYQGLGDLLEKRGVIANDSQIADWNGSELLKDSACPRVELTLEVLD